MKIAVTQNALNIADRVSGTDFNHRRRVIMMRRFFHDYYLYGISPTGLRHEFLKMLLEKSKYSGNGVPDLAIIPKYDILNQY